ncbi:MAG: hypothetical protein AB3N19_07680 [Ruegeria sp.]
MAADQLELVSLDEEMLPEPRVTAEAVFVGLVWPRLQGTAASTGSILAAIPPEMRVNDVCVRVTTEDGRYSGDARYRDTGVATSAMTILPYASTEGDLSIYADSTVAVMAFECSDSARIAEIAVTSWRSDAAEGLGDTANLLVNSFRADAAFLLIDGATEIECVPVAGGERAVFDFSCPLEIAEIQSGARVSLFRERGASLDPEVAIDIVGWK